MIFKLYSVLCILYYVMYKLDLCDFFCVDDGLYIVFPYIGY